jgi:hypothetical protein
MLQVGGVLYIQRLNLPPLGIELAYHELLNKPRPNL